MGVSNARGGQAGLGWAGLLTCTRPERLASRAKYGRPSADRLSPGYLAHKPPVRTLAHMDRRPATQPISQCHHHHKLV